MSQSRAQLLARDVKVLEFELADQTKATVNGFEAALIALDEVIEARRMFGQPDHLASVAVRDLHVYEVFLTEMLMALPGWAAFSPASR